MKFAKPIALIVGVLVVSAIAVVLVMSHIRSKEQNERMQALDRLEAMNKNAIETQERLQKSFEASYPSK